MRGVFDAASAAAPSVVFLDELDAIAPTRQGLGGAAAGGSAAASRLLTTLLTLLDGQGDEMRQVVVIAATNRPEAVDMAVRRPGRLDVEVEVGPPGPRQREEMLRSHLRRVRHAVLDAAVSAIAAGLHGALFPPNKPPHVCFPTPTAPSVCARPDRPAVGHYSKHEAAILRPPAGPLGFVASDVALLVQEAALRALRRGIDAAAPGPASADLERQMGALSLGGSMGPGAAGGAATGELAVTEADVRGALLGIHPSAMREARPACRAGEPLLRASPWRALRSCSAARSRRASPRTNPPSAVGGGGDADDELGRHRRSRGCQAGAEGGGGLARCLPSRTHR